MSDRNPIHRDRGRRDVAGEPARSAKETYSEMEADLGREASAQDDQYQGLTDEEQTMLQEHAAAQRFEEIARENAQDKNPSD